MMRENILGMFHGSISLKKNNDKFIINRREAIFDEIDENSLIELSMFQQSMWGMGSNQSHIHAAIYEGIPQAKYIVFSASVHIVSCSLNGDTIEPKDYFGKLMYPKIPVYDMKNIADWQDRASSEIVKYFKETQSNMMIVKGEGIYCYDRNLPSLIKRLSVIERSCHISLLTQMPLKA